MHYAAFTGMDGASDMIDMDIAFLEMVAKKYAENPIDSSELQRAAIRYATAVMTMVISENLPSRIIEDDIPAGVFSPTNEEMTKAVEQTMRSQGYKPKGAI